VQLDVVVTDKEGKPVVDLQPDDFEITEDKAKQSITNFSYITLGPSVTISQPDNSKTPRVSPAPVTPEQVHRTIALVVDDLGLSYESIASVKQALRKFVNEQMSPRDLVAVLRTSRGMGSLQQFTTNKNELLAAIDGISWYASGRSGLSPSAQIDTQLGEEFTQGAQVINEMEEARAAQYSVGTIQTLSRILRGLDELPGRKSIMMFAESFKLFSSQGRNIQLLESLERLTDQANRASTVIYTIDASGLNPQDMTASDRVSGASYTFDPAVAWGSTSGPSSVVSRPRNRTSNQSVDAPGSLAAQAATDSSMAFRKLDSLVQQRESQQNESRTVLSFLAAETGGSFTQNANDLSLGTQKMLQEQQGYYLIGYRPNDVTVDPATGLRRAHSISVKLKRSGLRLRTRSRHYGIAEKAKSSTPLTRDQQLAKALTSPFSAGGIGLHLTPIWGNDPASGSQLRVLLHVATQDLTFSPQPDGSQVAVLDFLAVSFGSEGRVVDQFSDSQSINITKDAYQRMVDEGLVFILNVPTKKAGPVQVRVAVRDARSERIGSANQFIEVPDLTKNNLVLSGIYLSGAMPAQAGDTSANSEKKTEKPEVTAGPAVRRLRHGMVLSYSYSIHNARLDDSKRPQLQTQMRLFRDAKEVFTGKPLSFNPGQQTDMKNLDAGGRLIVGTSLTPGQYVLQVTVTDALAKDKRSSIASQWIDFEIVK
jgi:VWFA-related protein